MAKLKLGTELKNATVATLKLATGTVDTIADNGLKMLDNSLKIGVNLTSLAEECSRPETVKQAFNESVEFFIGSEKEREFDKATDLAEAETVMVDAQIALAEKKAKLAELTAKAKPITTRRKKS